MMIFQQNGCSYESIVDAAWRKGKLKKLYRQERGAPPLTHFGRQLAFALTTRHNHSRFSTTARAVLDWSTCYKFLTIVENQ